ncbi:hypothetical protein HYX10_05100 [Candidatus Woesearchaeota archaeon]|nr:hypothetical protein [Candidatus Woesearchaeota archaeon]
MVVVNTALGRSQELDLHDILFVEFALARSSVPVITADFARRISSGYVVAEVPGNFVRRAYETFLRDEYETAWFYVEEVKEHNRKQREILDAYELGKMEQEDALKKAPLEKIFDALEAAGKPISAIRTQYVSRGFLSDMRTKFLLKFLSDSGLSGKKFEDDIREVCAGRPLENEGTWRLLEDKLSIKYRLDEAPPETDFRDVPPLIDELEMVVEAAFANRPTGEVASSVWQDAGMNPHAVYEKVQKAVKRLNSDYALVQVLEGNVDGRVQLVSVDKHAPAGLKGSAPKPIKSMLRTPVEILDDLYELHTIFMDAVNAYLKRSRYSDFFDLRVDTRMEIRREATLQLLRGAEHAVNSWYFNLYPTTVSKRFADKYAGLGPELDKAISVGFEYATIENSVEELRQLIIDVAQKLPESLLNLLRVKNVIESGGRFFAAVKKAKQDAKEPKANAQEVITYVTERVKLAKSEQEGYADAAGVLAEGLGRWNFGKYHGDTVVSSGRVGLYGIVLTKN